MDPLNIVLGLVALVLFAVAVALFFKNQRMGVENSSLAAVRARLEAENAASEQRLRALSEDQEKVRENARNEFQIIASKLLDEKSEKFTKLNKDNIEKMLAPLGKEIGEFRKRVEETYVEETKQRYALEQEVHKLIEHTGKVSQEANNLAIALKGEAKTQGQWGEVILERILELAGFQRGREYEREFHIKTDEGPDQRPDFVINLPEGRKLVIDSKVSLTAYERFSSAETDEDRVAALKDHLVSIANHVEQLSSKKYEELDGSLDFVLMFVAVEPAYLVAMRESRDLWEKAYSKRVILTSPTNLIAAVKLIEDLWKRELQSRNAMEIARQAEGMYDKFIGFLNSMDDIGRHLNNAQGSFTKAVRQLKEGPGNLVKRAEGLKSLGIKSKKSLPASMENFEEEE
ncbi:MAG: DNA recombination protein RmuC [Acidobacteria bacterium]|nr:MAG: DNA recombination protein RmuC [Acidobacteriota bacterium]REJ98185.1 MAG: DNA recombination protein RmuC [Acidobacteriota bacterium]REK16928.1 MAG: DNA recombination protein RmuC [Acidobacteriota bacterium]REK42839.1 MAG: DNA recombination protein RmuC [Acidobacteriota bacterium]